MLESEDGHVPHASQLRSCTETWEEAMTTWFHGGIICERSNRYIGNFLSVYRVRPGQEDDNDRADEDLASDEDVEVNHDDLEDVLKTRVGGRVSGDRKDDSDDEKGEDVRKSHHANSEDAIARGHEIWGTSLDG